MDNHQERESREDGGFLETELDLPKLPSRMFAASLADDLTSYLGPHNPFGHPVDSSVSTVWLLNNTAFKAEHFPHHWTAEFCVAYFLKDSGKALDEVVAELVDKLGLLGAGPEVEARIAQRLQPFVDAILPARTITAQIGGPTGGILKLGPGGRDGISEDFRDFPSISPPYKNGARIITKPQLDGFTNGQDRNGTSYFAEPEGWMVISDIDDTIKTTMTPSALGILRTTFAEDPRFIPNMPQLYAELDHLLSSPTWFYLSASPYNLYPFLYSFVYAHYPEGQIVLRDASWMDLAGFLMSLTKGTQGYKVSRMDKMHTWLPHRKVVCIGDSTQTDPESYAEIYKKYPGWVKRIFIRKVTDVEEMKSGDKNTPARFEKAFEGVPKDVWTLFEDPTTLSETVKAIPSL